MDRTLDAREYESKVRPTNCFVWVECIDCYSVNGPTRKFRLELQSVYTRTNWSLTSCEKHPDDSFFLNLSD